MVAMTQANTLLKLAIVVGVLLFVLPAVMWMIMPHSQAGVWSHMGDGIWFVFGGWLMMVLVPLLFVLLVGYFIYAVAMGGSEDNDNALETLREAYARGDIDDEEFDRRRRKLQETEEK